ncbi:MAG: NAD(+) synthase [Spirochaetaceae bacterium]|jgi:NAD+ synthase (glutamine-hydrolysing)|nr:NAD(+) synthase [Spirochaetaceae bacterium]
MALYSKDLGYLKIAGAVPSVKPGDLQGNREAMVKLYDEACKNSAQVVLFPELSLSGYTLADLFMQDQLLSEVLAELQNLLEVTKDQNALLIAGAPLAQRGRLYNCAVVLQKGKILGVVPKSYLPNSREFYEQRWFASGQGISGEISIHGKKVPFGADLIFSDPQDSRFNLALEICEDLWSPLPPSTFLSLGGASLILNPSASNELVGKNDYRKNLISQQSARCLSGYVYCSAGPGESTTDTVYSGRVMSYENGSLISENQPYHRGGHISYSHMDMFFLDHERRNSSSFRQAVDFHQKQIEGIRRIECSFPSEELKELHRWVDPHPFVPSRIEEREQRCREIFAIQSEGLMTRLAHIGCKDSVIGLSGGLDSTLALLVVIEAYRRLELPLSGIHGYTLPGFGTTERTKNNAVKLCEELEIPLETQDIQAVCNKQFQDLGHNGTDHDITYENVQARQRTQFLMNKANQIKGIVIGTGDLSELALGWCTYNGDHMSMYAVNTGVPKTLVRYLVEYVSHSYENSSAAAILMDIVNTPISPELLPPDKEGNIAQKTEDVVGPYELLDYFMYHVIRCGCSPRKAYFLAEKALGDAYKADFILHWLKRFYQRFFSQQFKRSCLPDGPKVGSLALSPRGDWRMPSDASAKAWLKDLEELES